MAQSGFPRTSSDDSFGFTESTRSAAQLATALPRRSSVANRRHGNSNRGIMKIVRLDVAFGELWHDWIPEL